MLKTLSRAAALFIVVLGVAGCVTSNQFNHYFQEGYKSRAESVVVSATLSSDKKKIIGSVFAQKIKGQLEACAYKADTVLREFPVFTGRYAFLSKQKILDLEVAHQDGVDGNAEAVVLVQEIHRMYYSNDETSRGFKVRYYDMSQRKVVWSSDIYLNTNTAVIGGFTSDQLAQNLSNSIIEHLAEDGIFADCAPESEAG